MIELLLTVVQVVLLATFVFHCLTYLLWLYELRVHGARGRAAAALPYWTAWLAEWLSLLLIVLALPLGLPPPRRPAGRSISRPVVLIHGWSLNRASFFVLAARLRRDGREVYAINYPSRDHDFRAKASRIALDLQSIAGALACERIDVVAHSQGGVLVRAAAQQPECLAVLGNVVTLGSPHRGAALADFVPFASTRGLRRGSRFLELLAQDDPLPRARYLVSVCSKFDAIVFPAELSVCPLALNVQIDYVGHHALLFSEQVYRLVKENLDAESRPTADVQANPA